MFDEFTGNTTTYNPYVYAGQDNVPHAVTTYKFHVVKE